MRQKIWIYLITISTIEGELIPKWMHVVRFLLFPIDYIFWHHSTRTGYQLETDTWMIDGQRYTAKLFRYFAAGSSETFRIVKRENGCITIETIPNT